MILDVEIRGLGVIDRAELPLGPGFTAITGETGAGKTMVVTALGLLLGGRAASGTVRSGAERAVVEGRWRIDERGPAAELVAEAGGETEPLDGGAAELLVSRQIGARDGRSRARLGGASVPAAQLGRLGEVLVAVHGQNDQIRLRGEQAQREALDAFGGPELAAARRRLAGHHAEAERLRGELERLREDREARAREAEELRQALAQIEPVDPQPGEDAELSARIERLDHREQLRAAAAFAHAALRGREHAAEHAPAAVELVQRAAEELERAARSDGELEELAALVRDLGYAAEDAALRLAGYMDSLDTEGVGELETLHERLASLNALMRRYGPGLEDVLRVRSTAAERLLELDGDDDRIDALGSDLAAAETALAESATRLTQLRRAAADRLAEEVTRELEQLAMPEARLLVEVEPAGRVSRHGGDRIAFLLRPHPGSEPGPIARTASGGELSRVMLALEVVLAGANPVPTFVFDEVDAGVGGAAAIEIGRRLRRLARSAQVVVVTHLAQLAAFADNHVRIRKTSDGEVTSSSIRRLDEQERLVEISRLLSGLSESGTAHAHARELLEMAEGERP
ncbi:MAG: DNA repair protein RecN [Pseudoclavibacter sp.]|nr:DNA repair protein RecN [Pseudoclavibacter sp.]